jgi:hypothetical protein
MLKPQKKLRKITTGLSVEIPLGKAPMKKE